MADAQVVQQALERAKLNYGEDDVVAISDIVESIREGLAELRSAASMGDEPPFQLRMPRSIRK